MAAAEPPGGRALCVLAHGMGGSAEDWTAWLECLRALRPGWALRPLRRLRAHTRPVVGKGLDELTAIAADEILQAVREEASESPEPVTLHCIGHSLGGLVLRAALPRVFEGEPELVAGTFVTLSTPHLGVQAGWGAPEAMWRNLSRLTAFISPQLPQLAVQDRPRGDRPPCLVALADPEGPPVAALARFGRRICVTMAHGDIVIPTASGSLWADRRWRRPDLPAHHVAGWGIEAYSEHGCNEDACETPSSWRSSSSSGSNSSNNLDWRTSAEGACWYPSRILEGLQTVSWERLVVRLRMPKATQHVFLIAKAADQTELEHCLARQCVERLAAVVAGLAEWQALEPSTPAWVRAVQARSCCREECLKRWVVATEEGIGIVKFYPFDDEVEARFYFQCLGALSRVLFDPLCMERKCAGANVGSFVTIRRHFAQPVAGPARSGSWTLATEEGPGNVRFRSFEAEAKAREAFDRCGRLGMTSRVLFGPCLEEVGRAGWNPVAHSTIVSVFRREVGGG